MLERLKSRLRPATSLPPATPATLRGYHGGSLRGAIVYASDDFSVAERYSDQVTLLEYRAERPLLLRSAEEARGAAALASRFARGQAGHDYLGDWARAQGYDALVLTAAARQGLGVSGFGELMFLEPERVKVVETIEVAAAAVPALDELLFHGTRADIAAEVAARGTLKSRHGKPIYFADDARYAAGHSGDKRLASNPERLASQQSGQVFAVRRADLEEIQGSSYTFATWNDVPIVGHVSAQVAFQGNEAVRQHLIDNPHLLWRAPAHQARPQAAVKPPLLPLSEITSTLPPLPLIPAPAPQIDDLL